LYPLRKDGDARNSREDHVPKLRSVPPQTIQDATHSEDGLFDRLLDRAEKGALKEEGRTILFVDQSGFYVLPIVVCAYGSRRPDSYPARAILRERLTTRDHLWAMSGIITPAEGKLLMMEQDRAFVRKEDDPDPKALSCYGLYLPELSRTWLRFVDGRPVSAITTQFLSWSCHNLEAMGKKALRLIWDNASWHKSKFVKEWVCVPTTRGSRSMVAECA
jgi:hypothetical protein